MFVSTNSVKQYIKMPSYSVKSIEPAPLATSNLLSDYKFFISDSASPFAKITFFLDENSYLNEIQLVLNDSRQLSFFAIHLSGLWSLEERCPECKNRLDFDSKLSSCCLCDWSRSGEAFKQYFHFEDQKNVFNEIEEAKNSLFNFFNWSLGPLESTLATDITLECFLKTGLDSYKDYVIKAELLYKKAHNK